MLEDLRTFFVQSMPLLFSVSFCMCFFSFVLGGCDFGQSFHKLYIHAMCLHGNREAGWLGVPLFVAEVNWTIGCIESLCSYRNAHGYYPRYVGTWVALLLSLLYLYNAGAWL